VPLRAQGLQHASEVGVLRDTPAPLPSAPLTLGGDAGAGGAGAGDAAVAAAAGAGAAPQPLLQLLQSLPDALAPPAADKAVQTTLREGAVLLPLRAVAREYLIECGRRTADDDDDGDAGGAAGGEAQGAQEEDVLR
jgi:hypothetical protein